MSQVHQNPDYTNLRLRNNYHKHHRELMGDALGNVPHTRPIKKLGRNEPCRCGSGRKYKKCCIHLDELENHAAAVGLK